PEPNQLWYANIGSNGVPGYLHPENDGAALTINAGGHSGEIHVIEGSQVITTEDPNTGPVRHGIVVNPEGNEASFWAYIDGTIDVDDDRGGFQTADGLRFTDKDGTAVNITVEVGSTGVINSDH